MTHEKGKEKQLTMGLTKIQYTPEELQKKREEAERKVLTFFLIM